MSTVEIIFLPLGVSLVLNILFFLIAFALKSDTFTDITYASTFLLTFVLVILINKRYTPVIYVLLGLVGAWSLRLGLFLFVRIKRTKVDHRFDKMRNSFWKFGAFWLLQGATVWIVSMPLYVAVTQGKQDAFNYYSLFFAVVTLFFLFFETIADFQKQSFNRTNKGHFINTGLWKISRHPNYFGEISFWWALFAFTAVNNPNLILIAGAVGPLYITITIYKLSGVRILEKKGLKSFGHDKNYLLYLKNTPCVIPFVGQRGYKTKWKF